MHGYIMYSWYLQLSYFITDHTTLRKEFIIGSQIVYFFKAVSEREKLSNVYIFLDSFTHLSCTSCIFSACPFKNSVHTYKYHFSFCDVKCKWRNYPVCSTQDFTCFYFFTHWSAIVSFFKVKYCLNITW